MCGRFVIFSPYDIIKESFAVACCGEEMWVNYNVCPTQNIPVVLNQNGKNILSKRHWGMVPFWAKDRSAASRMINARAETLLEKPSFRKAVKKRRCLIPANGYYEWKGEKGNKQPYYITSETGRLFAFAGLWERWIDKHSPGQPSLDSCAIITMAATPSVRHLHHRMPVILSPRFYAAWLTPGMQDADRINQILKTGAVHDLTYYAVSKAVNSVKSSGPNLISKVTI